MRKDNRGGSAIRGGLVAGLLVTLALFAVSCNTDTIGPIPNGVDESAATTDDTVAAIDDTTTEDADADDSVGDVEAPDADGPDAADLDAAESPDDLAFADDEDLGAPALSPTFAADGQTLASEDGAVLVTCGSAGIDVESDGRPIDRIAVSSAGEVSTFLDLAASTVSVSGVIDTVWVDLGGVEERFDC